MHHWQIITGEYPPQHGGVSDYTYLLAHALRDAGDEVEVWAPPCGHADIDQTNGHSGVAVHRLSGRFGPCALAELEHDLRRRSPSARLLVQYVPHMYGFKAMNVPFCAWLSACSRRAPWVMFHEVAFPVARGQRLAHNFLGVTHRLMAAVVARAAGRIFISVPQWEGLLRSLAPMRDAVTWLPIPSTMPVSVNPDSVRRIREKLGTDDGHPLIGHFSTYAKPIASVLEANVPVLLQRSPNGRILLLGRGSDIFAATLMRLHPDLHGRIHSRSDLAPAAVANHLSRVRCIVATLPGRRQQSAHQRNGGAGTRKTNRDQYRTFDRTNLAGAKTGRGFLRGRLDWPTVTCGALLADARRAMLLASVHGPVTNATSACAAPSIRCGPLPDSLDILYNSRLR